MAKTKTIESAKPVSGRGGYRPNAGRKPGQVCQKIARVKQITNKILQSEKVPLRIMMNNMVHYDEEATEIETIFEAQMAENAKQFSEEGFLKALELLGKIGEARMKAQKCAVDAAPYVHPKLSNITMDVHKTVTVTDIEDDADTAQFADEFRKLRSQPFLIEQADVEVEDDVTAS